MSEIGGKKIDNMLAAAGVPSSSGGNQPVSIVVKDDGNTSVMWLLQLVGYPPVAVVLQGHLVLYYTEKADNR